MLLLNLGGGESTGDSHALLQVTNIVASLIERSHCVSKVPRYLNTKVKISIKSITQRSFKSIIKAGTQLIRYLHYLKLKLISNFEMSLSKEMREAKESTAALSSTVYRSVGKGSPLSFPSFSFNREVHKNHSNPNWNPNPSSLTEKAVKPWDLVTIDDNRKFVAMHHRVEELGEFGTYVVGGSAYVASIKSLSNFHVLFAENWDLLEETQAEIQKWYSGKQPIFPLWNAMGLWKTFKPERPEKIEKNLAVMVWFLDEFHRAYIIKKSGPEYGDDFYNVETFDYGDVVRIHANDIYCMVQKFVELPIQAIHCRLALPINYDPEQGLLFYHPHHTIPHDVIQKEMLSAGLTEFKSVIFNKQVEVTYVHRHLDLVEHPWRVTMKIQNCEYDPDSINVVKKVTDAMEKRFQELLHLQDITEFLEEKMKL